MKRIRRCIILICVILLFSSMFLLVGCNVMFDYTNLMEFHFEFDNKTTGLIKAGDTVELSLVNESNNVKTILDNKDVVYEIDEVLTQYDVTGVVIDGAKLFVPDTMLNAEFYMQAFYKGEKINIDNSNALIKISNKTKAVVSAQKRDSEISNNIRNNYQLEFDYYFAKELLGTSTENLKYYNELLLKTTDKNLKKIINGKLSYSNRI